MSFRGDDQRRYGHVPPVQYPIGGQQTQDQASQPYQPRRQSFNTGDDANLPGTNGGASQGGRGGDEELFITSPTATTARPNYPTISNPAMSGYQHQYQAPAPPTPTQSTYNPQHFARSQSTTLPYHPHPTPPQRFGVAPTPTSPYAAAPAPAPATNYTPPTYNPAAYNPAAYAPAAAAPQRQSSYAQYGYGYGSPAVPQVSTMPSYAIPQPTQAPAPPSTASSYDQTATSPGWSASGPPTASSMSSAQYDPLQTTSYQGQQYFGGQYGANGASPNSNNYSAGGNQAPYPAYSQIPVGPVYNTGSDPNSFTNRTSRSNSQTSPLPSPGPGYSSTGGLQRHPTNAPLPSRPVMEEVPEESDGDARLGFDDYADEHEEQDNIMNEIEADLGASAGSNRNRPINGNVSDEDMERLRQYDSNAPTQRDRRSDATVGRYSSNVSTNRNEAPASYDYDYDDDDDESDPEGAAGVLAMQQAAMDDRRFSGIGMPSVQQPAASRTSSQRQPLPPAPEEQLQSDDSDFAGMDLGLFSGGYAGNLTYGVNVGSPPATRDDSRPFPTPGDEKYLPYPTDASVDYGGTGGLQAPTQHRLSFDNDEEDVSLHSGRSGSDSPFKEDIPEMFYHPGLSNRPLPALPPGSESSSLLSVQIPGRTPGQYQHNYSLSADSRTPYQAEGPDAYQGYGTAQQQPERSISLNSHSYTPPVQTPARSRTDAAEERRKALKQMTAQQQLAAQQGLPYDGYDTGTPSSMAAYDAITLPSGRRRKFVPSKLTVADLRRAEEPWALSCVAGWLREMADGEPDLKRKTIEEGIVKLFTFKVPTMNVADAEALSTMVVDEMFDAGILLPEEEWVKFGKGEMSGVLWQLTGSGCYAPKLHENEANAPRLEDTDTPVRCYSYHCTRTLKKANLDDFMSEDAVKAEDWATYFKLTKASIEGKDHKEIERQNNLHEIVTSEEDFMNQLDILRLLYRDQLRAWQPPIIAPNRLEKFLDAVFGRVDSVQQTNKEYLLAQLKYRQNEQGPWVSGYSDIFREWIRKARQPYIEYCASYPYASYLVRKEADKNVLFRQFLDQVRAHKRSMRLEWTTYVRAPIARLQRYSLLLDTVRKHTLQDGEEKANLSRAIDEIKEVTKECDAKVDEMNKKIALLELQSSLVLRPGFQSILNLDHLGRELLKRGDLQRMGSKGVRWVDTHALLFDHYLILAKAIVSKDGRPDKKYDVSKEPIPMPLLFLESVGDDPVAKQKGLTAPLARTTVASGSDTKLNKVVSNDKDRPGLEHVSTSSSLTAVSRLAATSSNTDSEGRILYPFKVKHLGHEVYTLYALSSQERDSWCSAIIAAKTRHAQALYAQNAEPFRLRVLADGAFAYDSVSALSRSTSVSIRDTPLDRAIREMDKTFGPGRGPSPVSRAQVNCATAFTAYGKSLIAIGTDYGVYISDVTNPRGWTRVSIPQLAFVA
jgi:hypothetical protein